MKLEIDIPEELYKTYKDRPPMLGDAGMDMIAQAIANGKPLPKRLLDADKFIDSLKGVEKLHIDDELRIGILDAINSNILLDKTESVAADKKKYSQQEPVILSNKEYRELLANEFDHGYNKGWDECTKETDNVLSKIKKEIMELDYIDEDKFEGTYIGPQIDREEVIEIIDMAKYTDRLEEKAEEDYER